MVFMQSVGSLCRKCQEAPKPVIGLINGYAGAARSKWPRSGWSARRAHVRVILCQ
jgi:hypothetical protein